MTAWFDSEGGSMKFPARASPALIIVLGMAWCLPTIAGNAIQTAEFSGLTPAVLIKAYLSSAEHSAMTGYPATYFRPATKAMSCALSAYPAPTASCST
jgi:hypothetical protein